MPARLSSNRPRLLLPSFAGLRFACTRRVLRLTNSVASNLGAGRPFLAVRARGHCPSYGPMGCCAAARCRVLCCFQHLLQGFRAGSSFACLSNLESGPWLLPGARTLASLASTVRVTKRRWMATWMSFFFQSAPWISFPRNRSYPAAST